MISQGVCKLSIFCIIKFKHINCITTVVVNVFKWK